MKDLNALCRFLIQVVYTLAGALVLPFIFFSPRLRQGWAQRLGLGLPRSCDIWIQGASAGECALIPGLVQGLAKHSIVATTCTQQGLEVLASINSTGSFFYRFFPFDLPVLMHWALGVMRPKVVLLLETEIWPGLLLACADRKIPVLVINGRMTTSSLAGYLWLQPLFALCPPACVAAIAPADALRYGLVFPGALVEVTGNSKFDRALETAMLGHSENPLAACVAPEYPFIVLGSVREEEEGTILQLLKAIKTLSPQSIIGLFPRHLHRVPAWETLLKQAQIPFVCRSSLMGPAAPGTVLLGDRFGELIAAYALASRTFVGGSLAVLGGQNFLEPLSQGILTAVGVHVRNFSWVGDEIFKELVFQSADVDALARFLTQPAAKPGAVRSQVENYIGSRQGATARALQIIDKYMEVGDHE